jgi:hypothetical protein
VKMRSGTCRGLWAICAVLITAVPVHAQDQTFAQLLTQAKAQAAAGHRWAPAGDNMTETAIRMIDLMPRATPAELAEFLSLLQADKSAGPLAYVHPDVPVAEQPTQSMPARASGYPSVIAALPRTQPPSLAEQSRQVNLGKSPSETLSNRETPVQGAPGQTMSNRAMPDPGMPGQTMSLPTMPGQGAPGQTMANRAMPDPGIPGQTMSNRANPDPGAPAQTMANRAMPAPGAPGQTMFIPTMSGQGAPGQAMSIPTMPGQGAPGQAMSLPTMPGQGAPGQTTGQTVPDGSIADAGTNRASQLYARGLDAELRGDLSGARRFYSTAARLGDAASARNLGRLYDPAYIKHAALGGIDPDPALARIWYERAINLGDADAEPLLEALSVR